MAKIMVKPWKRKFFTELEARKTDMDKYKEEMKANHFVFDGQVG